MVIELEREREREREREEERNNVKIMYKELQYMNSYYNFCAFMYNFTPIDVGVFFIKMCKITYFLYLARLCKHILSCICSTFL